jgi:DNA polymerase V
MGRSLITREGEEIEGGALNDVVVAGVVMFISSRTIIEDVECRVI